MYHRSSVTATAAAGIFVAVVVRSISRSIVTTTPIATIVPTVVIIMSSAFRPYSFPPYFFFDPFVVFNVV